MERVYFILNPCISVAPLTGERARFAAQSCALHFVPNQRMWRISKTLVCLLTAAIPITHGRTDDTPIPDLGDHTPDGLVVRCYWVGVFDMTSRFGTRSQRGTFGLLLADLNGEQKTHATFILTQEVDDHGKLRITSRDAHWSSTVSHLHYWSADGDRPGAGPGGTGGGDISPDDMSVNATEANG